MMAKIVRLEREVAALQGRDEGNDEGNHPPPDDATATAIARLKEQADGAATARATADELDEPSAVFDRVAKVARTLSGGVLTLSLAWVVALALSKESPAVSSYSILILFIPLAYTGQFAHIFDTVNSSAAGSAALRYYHVFESGFTGLFCVAHIIQGRGAAAVFQMAVSELGFTYYAGWLYSVARDRMRARFAGGLADHARQNMPSLLQLVSTQLILAVQGLAQGVNGPFSNSRIQAICTFSLSLSRSYVLSRCVYDAGGTDPTQMMLLRMSLREAAALGACALYVLAGFAGYVLAELDKRIDESTAVLVLLSTQFMVVIAVAFIGRLLTDAEKRQAEMEGRARDDTSTTVAAGIDIARAVIHNLLPPAPANPPRPHPSGWI
jgi:hypothetical protein